MIRDITIGQYYPSGSPLHRLDPRVKLVAVFVYVVTLFWCADMRAYVLAAVCLIAAVAVSGVPVRYMLRGLRPVWMLLIFTCVMQICFTRGDTVYVHIRFLTITREGIRRAATLTIRLAELVCGSSLLTYTTTPTELTDGLEKSFRPLSRLHVPVREIALIMSIALRFIPILTEELNYIMKAQTVRGVCFGEGRLTERIRRTGAIFLPLFASSVNRAGELALAMETRCFQPGHPRTKMHPLRYKRADVCGYALTAAYLAAMLVIKFCG